MLRAWMWVGVCTSAWEAGSKGGRRRELGSAGRWQVPGCARSCSAAPCRLPAQQLNIECNHATLAGHSCPHELEVAAALGLLGSVDANTGDPQARRESGWGAAPLGGWECGRRCWQPSSAPALAGS